MECLVCAETVSHVSVLPCGHADLCSLCTLRLRTVVNDKRCCACQTEAAEVYVARHREQEGWSPTFPKDLRRRAKSGEVHPMRGSKGVYFEEEAHRDEMDVKCALTCSVCYEKGNSNVKFNSMKALKAHLREMHGKFMCDVCLRGRQVFVTEQVLYTRSELNRHYKRGDTKGPMAEAGFKGHPTCQFCKSRFYSDQELYVHMQTKHLQCFLCKRARPNEYVYYRDLLQLTDHFREQHHFCDHAECKPRHPEERAFGTAEDLRVHEVRCHGKELSKAERKMALRISLEGPETREGGGGGSEPGRRRRGGGGGAGLRSQAAPFVPGGGSGRGGIIDDDIGLNTADRGWGWRPPAQDPEVSSFPPLPGQAPRDPLPGGEHAPPAAVGREHHPLSSAAARRGADGQGSVAAGGAVGNSAGVVSRSQGLLDRLEALVVEDKAEVLERESRERRRKRLADAFGVSDPNRPSHFAPLTSVAVPDDVIDYAAKHLDFVVKVERVVASFWERGRSNRMSLPAMTRDQRKVVHVVCNLNKVVSQGKSRDPGGPLRTRNRRLTFFPRPIPRGRTGAAYGSEPNRCVNLIMNPAGSEAPRDSLSAIARARLGGVDLDGLVEELKWEIKLSESTSPSPALLWPGN